MVSAVFSNEDGERLLCLPHGWVTSRIGETLTIVRGISFPKESKQSTFTEGYIACLRTANVQKEVEWDDLWFIPLQYLKNESKKVTINDILISTANSSNLVGKVSLVKFMSYPSTLGAFISLIRTPTTLNPKFIYYQLASSEIQEKFRSGASTTTNISNISNKIIEDIVLNIPPFQEQHRIVTKIEELFTQLDAGVASLKKVQAQLKRYRQAVLKVAFEGRLTQEWREGQNGLISVQKKLEQITIERQKLANINGKKIQPPLPISKEESAQLPDKPKGWHWVRLNELSGLITDGKHGDCRDEADTGYFFLSAKDIKNGKLHYENARQINKDDFLEVYNRTTLEAGDVVITNSGTIGRIAVIENNPLVTHTSFQKSVAIIKPIRNFFNSKYLSFYLLAVVQAIVKKSKGTAQKNLLIRDLKDFLIAIPTLEEQNAIVSEIERYFSQIDHLELTITTSLHQSETLRQSILKQAFEGKLVPQDPNDEPASILLERIKAEKSRHAAEVKKGKTLQPKSPKRKIQNAN